MRKKCLLLLTALGLLITALPGCDSASDLIDLAIDSPERRPIDRSRMGLNNFFVDTSSFGSIPTQFTEIRDVLGIRRVRILMAWTTGVQPSPSSSANYGFFDEIVNNIPPGVDAVVVLAHTPNWIGDPANWIDGNPRKTWVERWLKPTVARYADNPAVIGFEIWNEPDLTVVASDPALGLIDPINYFELLSLGVQAIRTIAPTKLILNAATRSINQDFPNALNYNKQLKDLGAVDMVDIWNIHYYGKQYERIVQSDGIEDFILSLNKPVWITESGAQGPNNQLAYVQEAWPFLREKMSNIDFIFYYQYGETGPIETNYGLKTTDPSFPVSDLYLRLRDNP